MNFYIKNVEICISYLNIVDMCVIIFADFDIHKLEIFGFYSILVKHYSKKGALKTKNDMTGGIIMRNGIKGYLCAYHQEVTGSKIIVVVNFPDGTVRRIMVDCGYFQEKRYEDLNYINEIDPEKIDVILVTHTHADHIGLLPKFVKDGYRGRIYMTKHAKYLCTEILNDSAQRQKENSKLLRKQHPDQKEKFKALYSKQDVKNATELIKGMRYRETKEIIPGIKVTYFENGHLLGSGMILLQCQYEGMESINFFFTGDYKLENCFYTVPELPQWLKEMPLVMIHEATNGKISSNDIQKNFKSNMIENFKKEKDIIIGAFAQGRMQELLYDFKKMQDEGILPSKYVIYVDGTLGVKMTQKYKQILAEYSPENADFIPKKTIFVDKESRQMVFLDSRPKIVITTSGMLSEGPARIYIPFFLEMENTAIQLIGYAAEGTLARALLDGKKENTVRFAGEEIIKRAEVKSTREKSGHAFNDEMIEFIKQFKNIKFMFINHGNTESQEFLRTLVINETKVKNVDFLNRERSYVIYQNTTKDAEYYDMQVRRDLVSIKLDLCQPEDKRDEKRKTRRERKAERKARRNAQKRKRKARVN